MNDLRKWQAPSLFGSLIAAGSFPGEHVIIWNPCDGYHLWRLSEYPAFKIIADFNEGFGSHWCLMPEGPDNAPDDWSPMNTLEDAYEIDAEDRDSPVL